MDTRREQESTGYGSFHEKITLVPLQVVTSCTRRGCRSICTFLILLVVCIIIQTLHAHPSSSLLKLFAIDSRAAKKYFWTNDNPEVPRPHNRRPPPPLNQQKLKPQPENHHGDHPPPVQAVQPEDVVFNVKHQIEGAGNLSDDGLLEKRNRTLEKTCQPKSHIVFLKTHKTASSTVQNILYRYGEERGLTFVLSRKKKHLLSYPKYFHTDFVEKKGLANFDILCNHMRFKKSEVEKLMPEDSFYFSIVRHSVSAMESAFVFFKHRAFSTFKSLDDLLDNSQDEIVTTFAHNTLAFDFGFDNTATADTSNLETLISKMIADIEKDFHLILITEYFDESMILLKHALCWSLEDVVSFQVNSRGDESREPVSMETAEKIKRWNILDWRIYEHFNTTFWNKVRSLVGEEEMKLEVSQLKELRDKLSSTCLEGGHAVNQKEVKDKTVKPIHAGATVIQGYNLKPNLDVQTKEKCQRMIMQYSTMHIYITNNSKKSN